MCTNNAQNKHLYRERSVVLMQADINMHSKSEAVIFNVYDIRMR